MAGENDPSLTETPEGRIVVLFMAFVAITYLFDKLTEWVDHYLEHHNRRGLLHTIHKLEEELLALGLISLILIALEDSIIRICVDSDGSRSKVLKKKSSETIKATSSEEMDDDYETEAVLSSELEGVDDGLQEDLQGIGENEDEELLTDGTLSDDLSGRRLLGSAMRVLLATGGGGGVCSEGKESFWSIRTIHETHIFIFTLAVVHIVFAGLSMVLCSWKVNQWKKWEEYRDEDLTKIDCSNLSDNHSVFVHYGRAFFAQFHQHINKSVYLSLRRLFIERMELDNEFEFHRFLLNLMEEEFSKVVKLEWVMWVVAAVWIATNATVVYIMTAAGLLLTLMAGTELESIALKLGNEAYIVYAGKPARGSKKQLGKGLVQKLGRISVGISNMLTGKGERHETELVKRTPRGVDPNQIFDTREGGVHAREETMPNGWGDVPNYQSPRRDSGVGHDSVYSVSPDSGPEISNAPRYLTDSGRRQATGDALGVYDQLNSTSMEPMPKGEPNQPQNGHRLQPCLSHVAHGPSSFLKGLWCCWGCCLGPADDPVALRTKTFSTSYRVDDSANLFPFKKPRVMLRIFQYTYFETSLMMAVLLFNLWQDVDPDFIKSPDWVSFTMVAVGTIVMVLTSILLLPVYWLTMVVGSHCPSKVLKKAKKKKVIPQVVNALEKVSVTLKQTNVNIARTSMGMNRQSVGLARKSVTTSVNGDTNSSIAEEPAEPGFRFPTHWADLERLAPVKQVENAAEGEDKGSSGALGMLVGAMLKNKQKELENLANSNLTEPHGPVLERRSYTAGSAGPPSLGRKSRPALHRISVPSTLPGIQEVQTPGHDETEDSSSLSRTLTLRSLVRSQSLSATDHIPLPELDDIQEAPPPPAGQHDSYVLGGKRMMRKSKSELDLHKDDSPRGVHPAEGGPGFVRPSLHRGSMPLTKVIGRKHKAYLARERHNANHLMQESPDEEEPEESSAAQDTPGKESGESSGSPPVDSSASNGTDDDSSGTMGKVVQPSYLSASSSHSDSETGNSVKSGVLRPSLDHMAELFKEGEKHKHQRVLKL